MKGCRAQAHIHTATDVFLQVTKAGLWCKAGQLLQLSNRIKLTENKGGLCECGA
jgi:hypothetical protein